MKKFLVLLITSVMFVITLTGCNAKSLTEANTTPDLSKAAYKAEANVARLKIETEDDAFWESTERMAELFKNTVEQKTDMVVEVRLTCSDGSTIVLNDFATCSLFYINDVIREKASNELIYSIATLDEVVEAHAAGKTVEVTGIILKWYQRMGLFDHNADRIASVCDLDNDGNWDYVTKGKAFFTDANNIAIENADGEILEIGVIDITTSALVPVEENLKFHKLYKLATVED